MQNNQAGLNIVDLSDYALLEVLKYVTSTDLWQLSRTCSRFRSLVVTKKLWKRIDLRDGPFLEEKVAFGLRMVNKLTEDIRLCSTRRHLQVAPPINLWARLSNTNLTVLALENQKLCGYRIKIANLPKTLVELSLRKSDVSHPATFLNGGYKQMTNLKVLILDQCFWVQRSTMIQLSKYRSLEILSMYDCKRIQDSDIPYTRLVEEFGFCALRIFDCRFSPLGDQTLQSLFNLQEMYFQNYHSSYFLDKRKRELEIAYGSPVRKHSYLIDSDCTPAYEKEVLKIPYGETDGRLRLNVGVISDEGPLAFSLVKFIKEPASSKYKSILYERPYRRCTCFKSDPYSQRSKGSASKMKSLKGRELAKTEKLVKRKLWYDSQDSTLRNPYVLLPNYRNQLPHDPSIEATSENHHTTDSASSGKKRKWDDSDEETDHDGGPAQPAKHKFGSKRLSFRGHRGVTDLTLLTLAQINLKLLDVTFTSVTEVGVKKFAAINPQCRVVHESQCKCRPRMHF